MCTRAATSICGRCSQGVVPNGHKSGGERHKNSSGNYARWTFIQWTDASGHFWESDYSAATNTYPLYNTLYDPTSKTFQFERDFTLYPDEPSESWIPNNVELLGETHNYDDQMPGGTGAHAEFYGAQYRLDGGSPHNMGTPATTTNSSIYGAVSAVSDDYRIWDKGCTS